MSSVLLTDVGMLKVNSTWRGDWVSVCNLQTAFGNVQPSQCKAWYGVLLSAQMTQSQVVVMYGSAPACNALPTDDSAPAPSYVRVDTSGH